MSVRRLIAWVLLVSLPLVAFGFWWSRSERHAVGPPPEVSGIEDEEVASAVADARRIVLEKPDSSAARGHYAMVLLAHLFDKEADACFQQASQLDPKDAGWIYARALIALKRRPEEAIGLLRQAVAAEAPRENRHAMRLQLGETLLERNRLEEAESEFQGVRQEDSNNLRAAHGLGLIAKQKSQFDLAERLFNEARRSPYARKQAAVQLTTVMRARGDSAQAEQMEQELAGQPADPPWPDPILDATVALQVGRRGRERRAVLLEQERKFAEAADLYLTDLKRKRSPESCLGAGVNLARIRDYARALPLLREAVQLDPGNPQGQYTLALVLYTKLERQTGGALDTEEAKATLAEVIAHAKKATEIKADHAHAYLFWGLALKASGRATEAIRPLQQGVACQPANVELQLALGEALLEAKRFADARMHLENASRLKPDDARITKALQRLPAGKPGS